MKKLLLVVAIIPTILFPQSRKERKALEAQHKADQVVIANLKSHVESLTGKSTPVAVEYISSQFANGGLQPKGTSGFLQPFTIDEGKIVDNSTYLKVNDALLTVEKEYFPLPYSAEKKVTGMPAMALRERGVPWFADVKDWLEDGAQTARFNMEEMIKKETARLAAKGASALFLYNSGSVPDGISFNQKDKSTALSIPVIYITTAGYKKYFSDHSQILDIDLQVSFKNSIIDGTNVIGSIDNAAPATVVIGAYYIAGQTNSKNEKDKLTDLGTDENAGGIAMLIEVAKMLQTAKTKGNNYLFIALGGNDRGQTAANYFLANNTLATSINYMLNLDRVGSYNGSKKLLVQGYNTSPAWKQVFSSITNKKPEVSIDSIGIINGPLVGFYNKEIPVLSFTRGDHADYLATTGGEDKTNYAEELEIAKFISRIIETADTNKKIAFTKTDQSNNAVATTEKTADVPLIATAKAPLSKTSVSLGVIPENVNTATGLKISGVTPNKLAFKIGLQAGDVLTNLGAYKISDLKSYLDALSNFKTGDKTSLKIKRGKDDKEFVVEF